MKMSFTALPAMAVATLPNPEEAHSLHNNFNAIADWYNLLQTPYLQLNKRLCVSGKE